MVVVWYFSRMFSKQEEMFKIHRGRARKRSQELNVLAVKPDDPSSNPRTHMVEGGNRSLQIFFMDPRLFSSSQSSCLSLPTVPSFTGNYCNCAPESAV